LYGVGLPEQFAFDTGVFDRVNRGFLTTRNAGELRVRRPRHRDERGAADVQRPPQVTRLRRTSMYGLSTRTSSYEVIG
jgi:hypothetical protein